MLNGSRDHSPRSSGGRESPPRVEERIVMTPVKKTAQSTTIRIERVRPQQVNSSTAIHVAGGNHQGIVISKAPKSLANESSQYSNPHLQLGFKVYLVNGQKNRHTLENRHLRFWYKMNVDEDEQLRTAQDFFKDLVSPLEFPKDYVGFIKKIMKLMQDRYPNFKRIEVELTQLEDLTEPPDRPTTPGGVLYQVGMPWNEPVSMDEIISSGGRYELTLPRVLEAIESAYPNPLSVVEMSKQFGGGREEELTQFVAELARKNIIRLVETGQGRAFVRIVHNERDVKVVRQMPQVQSSQQPTIAIITAQYSEKLAVDAMIDNKDTYVRYTTVGESNVYTLGNIGCHRVVATKLPSVGHSRSAMIAAGNTTTRLLGSFQKVEYVFLVGVGGGVPHYTDYNQHVKLGDVVISAPPNGRNFIYAYCEQVKRMDNSEDGSKGFIFEVKTWMPPNLQIQQVARQLCDKSEQVGNAPWLKYLHQAQDQLRDTDVNFERPTPDSDKLFMHVGGKDVIEVAHPTPPPHINSEQLTQPRVHFGGIGAGRQVVKDDGIRQEFAHQCGIKAFDTEFDAVVESIYGNRKDSYAFIRGVADYRDGTRKKEWGPYSALAAAAFTKAVISALPPLGANEG